VGVDHGGDDIGMSQQFLYRPDVITRFKKMRGKELVLSLSKEVTQGMATDLLVNRRPRHSGVSLRGITRQEDLVQYLQRMFSLPDLPVCNAAAFPQVSQEGFNILFWTCLSKVSQAGN